MSQAPGRVKKILLIDNMGSRQSSIVKKLEERGFLVLEVNNGKQGIGVLLGQPTDLCLIIIQTNLADVPAMEIAKHVRNDPKLAELPVVLSCTYMPMALLQEAAQLKINGVMATPPRDKPEEFNNEFESLLKRLKTTNIDVRVR
jgi:CheY-like chemotaxis protein